MPRAAHRKPSRLKAKRFIQILIDEISVPVIVDAGIGRPSQSRRSHGDGRAAVLANTAVAMPVTRQALAKAFSMAVQAGRLAYLSRMPQAKTRAQALLRLLVFFLKKTNLKILAMPIAREQKNNFYHLTQIAFL